MERFLDYIEKYKFAIIGTLLIHVVGFMVANFVTVKRPYGVFEEIIEIPLEADEIELDQEMLEMLNRQNQLNNEQLFNLASDQNDSRQQSYENFSTQNIDQQVENEARMLEQQFYDEWAATHSDDAREDNESSSDNNVDDSKNSSESNANPNETDQTGDNAFAGQVMVSYSLPNRNAHSLKIPGYTCYGSGTVVIDIKVDKSGNVKDATFNPSLSSGASTCMIEKAKRYARKSRFNYADTGIANGTITYKFQGQ